MSIGAAIKHFAPIIIQSSHATEVLTNNRPCVQLYDNLVRGEFSRSRVTISLNCRYRVHIRLDDGVANLALDFVSRNPRECHNLGCQVCKFVQEIEDSVIFGVSMDHVIDGSVKMSFTSRAAWHATQLECPYLRHTHAHLIQGTRPSYKKTKNRRRQEISKDCLRGQQWRLGRQR